MIIISPYARAGYTDSTPASFLSLLAYTEHTFGLKPLSTGDANAYDYSDSFNYLQEPLQAPALHTSSVPRSERNYIATHSAGKAGDT
jgi:hypothetical protein